MPKQKKQSSAPENNEAEVIDNQIDETEFDSVDEDEEVEAEIDWTQYRAIGYDEHGNPILRRLFYWEKPVPGFEYEAEANKVPENAPAPQRKVWFPFKPSGLKR